MSRRHLFAISVKAMMIATVPAYAGQFGPESDVVGLKLSMTQAQAKEFVTKSYPAAPLVMLPATIVSADFKLDTVTGFVFDMNSSQTNDPVLAQQGVDRAKILFNPAKGSSDIIAIVRTVNFGSNGAMTMAALRASLVEKYGRPVNSKEWGMTKSDVDYVWASGPNPYNAKACDPDTHVYRPYFYEDVWANRALGESISETSRGLANYISIRSPKAAARATCGTVLVISIRASGGVRAEYAYEMRETLIDLTRGTAELNAFRDDFLNKVNQLKSDKFSKDSQNKPKL